MSNRIPLFREVNDLRRYLSIAPTERPIVFYAEDKQTYSYFQGIIEYIATTKGKRVHYVTSARDDPLFKLENPNIVPFYVNKLLGIFTQWCNSKTLTMTMPDLETFHVKRSRYKVNHVYIFHNVGTSFSTTRFGALFHYDTVFCVGPHHVEEIRRQEDLYRLKQKELVEFGDYRVEAILRAYKMYLKRPKEKSAYAARVLLAPTWGDDSLLNMYGETLISHLLKSDYEVIVRPHPMTLRKHMPLLKSLNQKFSIYPNFSYQPNIAHFEGLFSADVMITDWSGVMYEYAFGTERPIVFVGVPQKIVNPRYEEVGIEPIEIKLRHDIGLVVRPDEISEVGAAITHLMHNRENYQEKIITTRNKYIFNFGNSSRVGGNYLLDFCGWGD